MTLDDILKNNAKWLEQALKRRPFEKVDDSVLKSADESRERRIEELKMRIGDLERRKASAVSSYDRAIAQEQAELDALSKEKPFKAQMERPGRKPAAPDAKTAKRRK